ncbi:MAG: hypothetical protein ACOVRB_01990 [Akkermansiaceae bacterium]
MNSPQQKEFLSGYGGCRRSIATVLVIFGGLMGGHQAHSQSADVKPASSVVCYEDFGAKGDGVTDDVRALVKAHEHANAHRLPVRAKGGAIYRIGKTLQTIVIETNTDFAKAKFLIDDSELQKAPSPLFLLRSRLKAIDLVGVKSLQRKQTKMDVKLPVPSVVIVTNKNVKQFIRRGNNANDGSAQTDMLLVNVDGTIAPSTPVIWNFDEITSLKALPVDPDLLKVSGGHFTTIANAAVSQEDYFGRGIVINRSNVVLDGIEHHITGEGASGAPYRGFISVSKCANVLIRNSVFAGHKTYQFAAKNGQMTSKGTYDLRFDCALNVTLFRCRQSNDILDSNRWGIMGSNFCKNLTYDQCQLSRFDAHQGVTHVTIRDSVIGHAGLQLTGFGTFLIENSTVKSGNFVDLRPDYGSTWTGEWIIRNCRHEPQGKITSPPILINGSNDGRHNFGYECQMPWRISIDGLHVMDGEAGSKSAGACLLGNFHPRWSSESSQPFPYTLTKEIHLKNYSSTSGQACQLSTNAPMFQGVRVIEK